MTKSKLLNDSFPVKKYLRGQLKCNCSEGSNSRTETSPTPGDVWRDFKKLKNLINLVQMQQFGKIDSLSLSPRDSDWETEDCEAGLLNARFRH
jgi:hypothetical protein